MRLLVVTLCCFVAPPIVRADHTEDAAIKAIKQRHGKVEQKGKVVRLSADATDAELKQLVTLENLTDLDLCMSKISDTGLMELSAIPGLAHLGVGFNVSDAGKWEFERRNPKCELSGPTWSEAIKR
jgi:hypothetical protein